MIEIGTCRSPSSGYSRRRDKLRRPERDQDDVVFIPITTAKLRVLGGRSPVNRQSVDLILVKATAEDALPMLMENIRALLRQLHRLPSGSEDDFQVASRRPQWRPKRQQLERLRFSLLPLHPYLFLSAALAS